MSHGKSILWLLLVTFIFSVIPSCVNPQEKDNDSPASTINVAVGNEFTISAKPNASTGWMLWLKTFNADFVTLVANREVPGVFQARDYVFKALKKGKTEIQMESKPYWWDNISSDKQKQYPVQITVFSITMK